MSTTETIGPSGCDYTAPQSWYDAHSGDITADANAPYIGEIEKGSYPLLAMTGSTTDATHYFRLRAMAGNKFHGILDDDDPYASDTYPKIAGIVCNDDYTRVECIASNDRCSGRGFWVRGSFCILDSCAAQDLPSSTVGGQIEVSGTGSVLRNCVSAKNTGGLTQYGIYLNGIDVVVFQCVVHRMTATVGSVYGIYVSGASGQVVRNSAVGTCTGNAGQVSIKVAVGSPDVDYNAVTEAAVGDAGPNSQTNLVPATEWVGAGATGTDFHMKSTGVKLKGNAGSLVGYSGAPTIDIDGQPIAADIGIDSVSFGLETELGDWYRPLEVPTPAVPPVPMVPEGEQYLGAEPSLWPTPETITMDKWAQPFSGPTLPLPPVPEGQQFFQAEPSLWPPPETITVDKWMQPLSEPILPVPPAPEGQQFHQAEPSLFALPEVVSLDKWFQPLSEPTPVPPTIVEGFCEQPPLATSVLLVRYYVDARGVYRVFNEAAYRFYRTMDTDPPATTDAVWATSATLPATPTDTFADGTWRLSISKFNGVYDSGFYGVGPEGRTWHTIVVIGGKGYTPPVGPLNWYIEDQGGGVVRVVASVHAGGDDDAPDEWAIGYTIDTTDPPKDTPDETEAIAGGTTFGSSIGALAYDLPAQADGTEVRVRLQTRRNDGTAGSPIWVYSDGSTVKSITVDAGAVPTAPLDGAIWPGALDVEEG